ncbi:MAG: 50S ribosomal protein L3 [Patescibacteria group bacterium]|nr:50S ribosomal protein L3 [Patescibacteria group bacterium]
MKFILGKKQHMVQYFDDNGNVVPATVISAGPNIVTQVKTPGVDGYTAVQVAFEEKKRANKVSKNKPYKHLREFRDIEEIKVGDKITVEVFAKGDNVFASGISKGKGFQGVVKRHGFHGGNRTHGQRHSEREAGSIGATGPQRVFKGKKMPGRMGGDRITVKNLKVVDVDVKNNQLLIKGAIPGRKGSLIEIVG